MTPIAWMLMAVISGTPTPTGRTYADHTTCMDSAYFFETQVAAYADKASNFKSLAKAQYACIPWGLK